MPVELRQLRYIVAAANHRSFRHAAASLGVKQSTLSRAVHVVEERLCVKLFDRSHSGARPTAAGMAFFQGAELIVRTTADIVQGAKAAGRGEHGRLALGCYSAGAARHLHGLLATFRETVPEATIVVTEGSRARLAAQLGAGAIDIAFITGDTDRPEFRAVPAWSERIVALLPHDHHLASRDALHWTDLAGEQLLATRYDPGPEIESLVASKLAAATMRPVMTRHDVTNSTIHELAGLGLGVALVCESTIDQHDRIVVRDIRDGSGPSGLFFSAIHRRDDRNPMTARFLMLLRDRYPSHRDASEAA